MSRFRRRVWLLAVLAIICVGAWLRRDALTIGFHGDDYVQIGMLRGQFPAPRSPFDLFRFADSTRDGTAVIEFGYDPWWTTPDLKLAMFRPLSSALIALDHRLFGANDVAHHVHSLIWWALLVGACAWLLRLVLPIRVAAVAVALFAIEEAHTVPLAWLANRSTLVATTLGLLALALHIHWRARRGIAYRLIEGAAFLLALTAGEYAFSVLAYVFAFELFGVTADPRDRARALVPPVAAAALCLAAGALLGFGVQGSGYYISPFEAPRDFLAAAFQRVPVLAGDLVWSIPAAWWVDGMPWASNFQVGRNWQHFLGLVAIAALALAVRFLERHGFERSPIRWLVAGSVLSLIPSAGALPEDRTLVAASVGASALFAVFLVTGYDVVRSRLRKLSPWIAAAFVSLAVVVLLVHGGKAWARSSAQVEGLTFKVAAQRRWALDADIPDATIAQKRVVIVTGGDFTTIANLPWVRLAHGHPLPRSYTRLSGALWVHEITRTAPNVIELAVFSNELEDTMVGSLYRSKTAGFRPGDVVTIPGMRVEVLRTEGPHPWRTRITFEPSLDDPSYLFLHSMPDGIRPFTMPAVGEKLQLAPPARPRL